MRVVFQEWSNEGDPAFMRAVFYGGGLIRVPGWPSFHKGSIIRVVELP